MALSRSLITKLSAEQLSRVEHLAANRFWPGARLCATALIETRWHLSFPGSEAALSLLTVLNKPTLEVASLYYDGHYNHL